VESQILLFPSRRHQCAPQPIRPGLPGITDGALHLPCFIWRQSNRKNRRNAFFRETRTAHFLFHKKSQFRKRNQLTAWQTFVYNSVVSKFEIAPCQNNARTSLARLADQRHPAVTGAGNERLAMKARSLKIEKTGDFWRGKVTPKIRLGGQWLQRAGFKPGHRVEIRIEQPGNLTLRFLEQSKEARCENCHR